MNNAYASAASKADGGADQADARYLPKPHRNARVRRALMTSVSQITQKISEQNAAEFGADGWEISAHVGARPSHAVYQGRQYPN